MDPTPVIISHLDDIGCSAGSIVAFDELTRLGSVTSGSIIVPSALFGEVVALNRRRPGLDLGVHLTLTSESQSFRWGPVSEGPHTSELTEPAGWLWPSTSQVRRHASPEAVEIELRAQVQVALDSGIDITHFDHHMGAAAAPEFVEVTVRLAAELGIPALVPADVAGYFADLDIGEADPAPVVEARRELAGLGLSVADMFVIGYNHQDEPCREVYQRLIANVQAGTTFLSLHCSAPGDIETVHPESAAWRIAEYELFGDRRFREWIASQGVELAGIRDRAH